MTPDPAGMAAVDPGNPQSWNRYAYVLNNPMSYVDASGLSCEDPHDGSKCVLQVTDTPLPGVTLPTPSGFPGSSGIKDNTNPAPNPEKGCKYNGGPCPHGKDAAAGKDVPLTQDAIAVFSQVGRTAPQVVHPCTIAGFYAISGGGVAIASQTATGAAAIPELSDSIFSLMVRTVPPAVPYVRRAEKLLGRAIVAGTAAIKAGCDGLGN